VGAHLIVPFESLAKRGEARTIRIEYGALRSSGLHVYADHAYTAFHTDRWMPCTMHPGDRAELALSLTVPAGWEATATGEPRRSERLADGRTLSRFRLSPGYPSYLFGFAAGRFQRTTASTGDVELEAYALPGVARPTAPLLEATGRMMHFFEERSGVVFPGHRYTSVLVPGGAAQEAALLSYLDAGVVDDLAASPPEEWLPAHELAHSWWGNRATCADWGEFWLNEAVTVLMVAAYKEQHSGRPAYEHEVSIARTKWDKHRAAGRDRPLWQPPQTRVDEAGGPIVYSKGALVLYDLRELVGDAAFWEGMRLYDQVAPEVRTVDLERAMEKASGRELQGFFGKRVYTGPVKPSP
jgi:aminopeptidase N